MKSLKVFSSQSVLVFNERQRLSLYFIAARIQAALKHGAEITAVLEGCAAVALDYHLECLDLQSIIACTLPTVSPSTVERYLMTWRPEGGTTDARADRSKRNAPRPARETGVPRSHPISRSA